MKGKGWVVAAKVGPSEMAKRTDSSGDMEQLELMELILVAEHDTKAAAQHDATARRAKKDGWKYTVMARSEFDTASRAAAPKAA